VQAILDQREFLAVDQSLAEVRRRAKREGWYYQHIRAIIVLIDSMQKAYWAIGTTISSAKAF
jgi:hypothetical protein